MKEYCVNLELAKELKENGYPQNSYNRYQVDILGEVEIETLEFSDHDHVKECYSAPTSDEILKELPNFIIHNNTNYYLNIFRDTYTGIRPEITENYYEVSYITLHFLCLDAPNNYCVEEDKLSNALAKMWLYLKKEGHIK